MFGKVYLGDVSLGLDRTLLHYDDLPCQCPFDALGAGASHSGGRHRLVTGEPRPIARRGDVQQTRRDDVDPQPPWHVDRGRCDESSERPVRRRSPHPLYRPWILRHPMATMRPAGRRPSGRVGSRSELGRRAVSVALDRPGLVAGPAELQRREAPFLDGGEGPDPGRVLLRRPDEALGPQPLPSGTRRRAGDGVAPRPGRARAGRRGACVASRGRGGPRGPGRRPRRRRRRARGCPAGSARAPRGVRRAGRRGRLCARPSGGRGRGRRAERARRRRRRSCRRPPRRRSCPGTIGPSWRPGPRGRPTRAAADGPLSRGEQDRTSVPWTDVPTSAAHPLPRRGAGRGGAGAPGPRVRRARAAPPGPRSRLTPRPVGAVGERPPGRLDPGSVRHRARRSPPASGPQVPSSGIGPAGPGRRRGGAGASAARRSRWTPGRATPQTRQTPQTPQTRAAPWRRRGEIETTALVAQASAPRKGRPPPACNRSIRAASRPASIVGSPPLVRGRATLSSRSSRARLRGARRASRRHRPPSPRARAPRSPAARPAPPRSARSAAQHLRPAVIRRSRPGAATAPARRASASVAPPRPASSIPAPPSALDGPSKLPQRTLGQ